MRHAFGRLRPLQNLHHLHGRYPGNSSDALPYWLPERGWQLHAASHFAVRRLVAATVPALSDRLIRAKRPVELLARQAWPGLCQAREGWTVKSKLSCVLVGGSLGVLSETAVRPVSRVVCNFGQQRGYRLEHNDLAALELGYGVTQRKAPSKRLRAMRDIFICYSRNS